MNVEFKITSPIHVPVWTNTYELDVRYMHGDANAYSTETNYYDADEAEEIAALHRHLKGLHFMQHLMRENGRWRADAESQKQFIIEFFEKLGYQSVEDEDEDSDTYLDMVPHADVTEFLELFMQQDTTDDSYEYNAIVKDVNLYYYNAAGEKLNVEVTITKDANEN